MASQNFIMQGEAEVIEFVDAAKELCTTLQELKDAYEIELAANAHVGTPVGISVPNKANEDCWGTLYTNVRQIRLMVSLLESDANELLEAMSVRYNKENGS